MADKHFVKGKKSKPSTINLSVDTDEKPISISIKASIEDLRKLKDMVLKDPRGVGLSILDGMSHEDIVNGVMRREGFECDSEDNYDEAFDKAVVERNNKKKWNYKKSEVAREIKSSACWFYAIVRELKDRKIPLDDWPSKLQDVHRALKDKGHDHHVINPIASPTSFVYYTLEEAYFDEAKEVGLTIFSHPDSEEVPESFGPGYLFDNTLSPDNIREKYFKGKPDPEEFKEAIGRYLSFPSLKRLFSHL